MADGLKIRMLVTGDSLGQVSSQTGAHLVEMDRAVEIPIIRPLVALRKEEIIALARQIGTFEMSSRTKEVCDLSEGHRVATKASPSVTGKGRRRHRSPIDGRGAGKPAHRRGQTVVSRHTHRARSMIFARRIIPFLAVALLAGIPAVGATDTPEPVVAEDAVVDDRLQILVNRLHAEADEFFGGDYHSDQRRPPLRRTPWQRANGDERHVSLSAAKALWVAIAIAEFGSMRSNRTPRRSSWTPATGPPPES